MKILVAEAEQEISQMYKMMLEHKGYRVTLTGDGEECVQAYNNALSRFDVVILDYRMPKLDGMQTAKGILAINPHQRIIFASA